MIIERTCEKSLSNLSTYFKMHNVRAREMEGARDLFLPLSALCLVMTKERVVEGPRI